ncbi:pyridoxal-phosphate-dependent aminotransferase family protein [Oceanithermus sp.]
MSTEKLLTPGPVCLHPAARKALAAPQIHHRSQPAEKVLASLRENARLAAATTGETVVITGSGTAAMTALATGLFAPGDRVWVPVAGKFSERWAEIARSAGLEPLITDYEWGQAADPADVPEGVQGALLTHSETSTGVLQPLKELAAAVRARNPRALVVADAVTSFLLSELRMDDWQVDALAIGSQKGLMSPPGLGLALLGPRALSALRPAGYYLNLDRELTAQKRGQTAYTPAINLVAAAAAVLEEIMTAGLSAHLSRKQEFNERFYQIGLSAGLKPVPQEAASRSPATAAFFLPEEAPANAFSGPMLARGWRIAGGQGPLKGKIFRISAMGYLNDAELEKAYTDFEEVLRGL